MPKLRVHNFAISLDGYAAGPNQSRDNPLGVGGTRLHEWAFATRSARQMHGMDGGDEGLDDEFIAQGDAGIGVTIIGRNMFGSSSSAHRPSRTSASRWRSNRQSRSRGREASESRLAATSGAQSDYSHETKRLTGPHRS